MASDKWDKRLANLLVRSGLIEPEKAEEARTRAAEEDKTLASALVESKLVDEKSLLSVVSRETGCPPVDLEKLAPDVDLSEVFGQDLSTYYGVLPVSRIGDILTMAVSDPFDVLKLDDIRIITGLEIRPVLSTEDSIRSASDRYYNKRQQEMEELFSREDEHEMILTEEEEEEQTDDLSALKEGDESSPVVKFVNLFILEAIKAKASDIHIEPMEKRVRLRYRIDGVLQDVHSVARQMQMGLVSRVKIMANLDIAEKGRPQDGMFQMRVDRRKVDFRISIIPTTWGEKVVIRILDGSALVMTLDALGFEPESLEHFRWAIRQPYGMILATGPSGCGKTTTLYSGLTEIMSIDDNIITVEDPVEYQMEGVNQVQVNPKAGLTFAAALRSILRQDPDKIMVGEVRDSETIEISLRAALTGHLVLSTLHTNDAAQAVTRILNMGVDNFLVASTGLLITGQRLARKLCTECKKPAEKNPEELARLQFTPEEIESADLYEAEPRGCSHCYKGYKGRVAVIESLRFTEKIRRAVVDGANALAIKKAARTEGMVTLRRSGIRKVAQGLTSIDEMKRVTMDD